MTGHALAPLADHPQAIADVADPLIPEGHRQLAEVAVTLDDDAPSLHLQRSVAGGQEPPDLPPQHPQMIVLDRGGDDADSVRAGHLGAAKALDLCHIGGREVGLRADEEAQHDEARHVVLAQLVACHHDRLPALLHRADDHLLFVVEADPRPPPSLELQGIVDVPEQVVAVSHRRPPAA